MFVDPSFSPAERDRELALAARSGVTDVRADAFWEIAEPNPPTAAGHRYDWRYADEVAGRLARHGMRWWAVLDYAPGWAARDPRQLHSPPRDPRTFATWSSAFARRYGPGGAFWRAHPQLPRLPVRTYEVWNEPNVATFWRPSAEPEAYAALFDAAQAAVRQVQPDARMVTGGLAPFRDFVRPDGDRAAVAADHDLGGRLPSLRTDPGRAPRQGCASRGPSSTRRASIDVPLALTELGWALEPPGDPLYVSQGRARRYLAQSAREPRAQRMRSRRLRRLRLGLVRVQPDPPRRLARTGQAARRRDGEHGGVVAARARPARDHQRRLLNPSVVGLDGRRNRADDAVMSTSTPRRSPRRAQVPSGVLTILWVLVVAFVVGYLFLVLIGAWDPADVVVPTIVFIVAVVFLVVFSIEARRGAVGASERDPRLVRDRERRGF